MGANHATPRRHAPEALSEAANIDGAAGSRTDISLSAHATVTVSHRRRRRTQNTLTDRHDPHHDQRQRDYDAAESH
jgi:hypothetical protein